jgi:hypothetical protein
LHLRALERATGKELRAQIDRAATHHTHADIEASRKKIGVVRQENAPLFNEEELHPQWQRLFSRAKVAISHAADRDRDDIVLLTKQIEEALHASDQERADKAAQELEDILLYVE